MDATSNPRSPAATKLAAVGAVGLLLGLPLLLVGALHWERQDRASEVEREIALSAGGDQAVHGPFLEVPHVRTVLERVTAPNGVTTETSREVRGSVLISAQTARVEVSQRTRTLRRAIYEVPAHTSTLQLSARFDPTERLPSLPPKTRWLWSEARWWLGVSDLRGVGRVELAAVTDGRSRPLRFDPAPEERDGWGNLTAPASLSEDPPPIEVRGEVVVRGLRGLHLSPPGSTTEVTVRSDWPHPSFDGVHLPTDRQIDDQGFEATWSISSFARGLPDAAHGGIHPEVQTLGVTLVDPADGYAQVGRSLKYALMFVMLTLAGFLVLELSSGVEVHPAQYGLLGLAQVSFYLLLLATSEHVSIEAAYLASGLATTLLTGLYADWTFGLRRFAAAVLVGTGVSYGFQYVLVRLEDHALLMGAGLVFAALAVVMYATRRLRWYRRA